MVLSKGDDDDGHGDGSISMMFKLRIVSRSAMRFCSWNEWLSGRSIRFCTCHSRVSCFVVVVVVFSAVSVGFLPPRSVVALSSRSHIHTFDEIFPNACVLSWACRRCWVPTSSQQAEFWRVLCTEQGAASDKTRSCSFGATVRPPKYCNGDPENLPFLAHQRSLARHGSTQCTSCTSCSSTRVII